MSPDPVCVSLDLYSELRIIEAIYWAMASQVALVVKSLPASERDISTPVSFLEDPLE